MDRKLEERLKCYMTDCGCDAAQTAEYLKLAADGCTQDQIYLLKRHRNRMISRLHTVTRQVDCIDYVIHELEQEAEKNG